MLSITCFVRGWFILTGFYAQPVFGSQQEEGKEQHEDYVRKELRRKDAVYYSSEFVGAEKLLFTPLSSGLLGLQGPSIVVGAKPGKTTTIKQAFF